MPFYVYIIQSSVDGTYYKGITENYFKRIEEHNSWLSRYTSRKMPWKLIYIERYETKSTGLKREKVLKKYSHKQIQNLVSSSVNKNQHLVDEWLKSLPNIVGD